MASASVHTRMVVGSNPTSATKEKTAFTVFSLDPKVYTKNILRLVGQVVKTRPFHGCNTGSTPVRVTKSEQEKFSCSDFLVFYKKRILLNPDKFFLKK